MELGWRMFCIKALTHNFPGWRETKTQGEYLFGKHGNPPEGGLSKLGEVGQFHIKRRRTKKIGILASKGKVIVSVMIVLMLFLNVYNLFSQS
jgi:hypothetical protein